MIFSNVMKRISIGALSSAQELIIMNCREVITEINHLEASISSTILTAIVNT